MCISSSRKDIMKEYSAQFEKRYVKCFKNKCKIPKNQNK